MKQAATRPAEYFDGYRAGHDDGVSNALVNHGSLQGRPVYADGYWRGLAAGAGTRAYAVVQAQREHVPIADRLYDEHLETLRREEQVRRREER
jgi:hypothetical protein